MPQHVVIRQNLCIELFYLVSVPCNAGNYFDTHLYIRKVKVLVIQSCPTLCDPMDCSLPGSSVHGFLQAKIPEWVTMPFFRGSFQPRDRSHDSLRLLQCRQVLYHQHHPVSPVSLQGSVTKDKNERQDICLYTNNVIILFYNSIHFSYFN